MYLCISTCVNMSVGTVRNLCDYILWTISLQRYVYVCMCTFAYMCISCVFMAPCSRIHRLARLATLPAEAVALGEASGTGLNPSDIDSCIYRAPSRT